MNNLFFFLIFAFACTKDKIDPNNGKVTISNANPVQFWLTGEDSFNQKVVCSIYPVCFCQPFDCDDTITIQFSDSSTYDFQLLVYDHTDSLIKTFTFNNDLNGHFYFSFTPSDYNICQKILLKIQETESFVNGDFETGALSQWKMVADGGLFSWVASSTGGDNAAKMEGNFSDASGSSKTSVALRHDYDQIQATSKKFNYKVVTGVRTTTLGTWNNSDLVVVYYRNGTEVSSQVLQTMANNTTYNGSFTTSESNFDAIGLRVVFKYNSPFSGDWSIFVALFEPQSLNNLVVAQSDCIDITTDNEIDCSMLLEYSNSTDFAGLTFQDISPGLTFNLRIPAVFFEEEYPQEQEDLELSDDTIVTLWSKIEGKKLLDIGYMPFYMHKKLQMILMMDSITIDGIEYRKRDEYQITAASSKRSALRRAQVLLSEKDFINRNLL